MNKSVADYVDEHLATQDKALDKKSELVTTTDANHVFSDAELAATLNAERLHELLQHCDSFLALTEYDMADFEDKSVKSKDEANNKKAKKQA